MSSEIIHTERLSSEVEKINHLWDASYENTQIETCVWKRDKI